MPLENRQHSRLLGLASPSHHIWNHSLMLALAARGHKITLLTTDAEKNPVPNYTEHIIENAYDMDDDPAEFINLRPFNLVDDFVEGNTVMCNNVFSAEGTENVMKLVNNTSFNLIIAEITAVECLLGFVHLFGRPPLIGITAFTHPLWASYMTWNPQNPVYVPEIISSFKDHMSFLQRMESMVREYFGEDLPSIREIRNNVSLVLAAYKVLWKWESNSLPGQPSNVIVGKWMPQRDILDLKQVLNTGLEMFLRYGLQGIIITTISAHHNIVLFITHNGLLSTLEAMHNGVPIIGVPFFADQNINAAKSKAQGFAEYIDISTVTAEELFRNIHKVTNYHRYKENAQRLSKLAKDQPQTPLSRAVFWTEYEIRHKEAPHLRSAAADMPWYQYLLLDVVFFLVAVVLVVLLLFYKVCSILLEMVVRSDIRGSSRNQSGETCLVGCDVSEGMTRHLHRSREANELRLRNERLDQNHWYADIFSHKSPPIIVPSEEGWSVVLVQRAMFPVRD
ncbi:hypothetical protein PR048_010028 [Dryococelus australis]|uniref:Uncharacterized protein n=1 Tax=Dryococelus australis TaxID=614101 RepID=A0ABQ9I1J4_9NEOP|nr:hypothetical protein PR048_010028 [Dryococelus australis]